METGDKGTTKIPKRDQKIPLTVAKLQDRRINMIGTVPDTSAQNLSRSKLTLVITKAGNDNDNKKYDKLHGKNEENKRLLNSGQKKIVIVPSVHPGTVVSTNGVKQNNSMNNNGRFSVTPSNRNGQKTECMGGLRTPQFVDIPRLDGNTHSLPLTVSSLRSLKLEEANGHQPQIITPSNQNWSSAFCFSEVASHMSVRSLASIGMGSTDGRKVTIRRVPTSPTELFNIVHSPT